MQDKLELKIDWANHDAAKYACQNWHYSKCLPVGKLVKVGVWEDEKFIGVVLFSRGASKQLGTAYDLSQTECCELTRVALTKHQSPVSRILAIAIKFLKKNNPGILLVVSFADKTQGHHGGIYQAGNWVYTGRSASTIEYFLENRWQHARNSYDKKTNKTPSRRKEGKHRYLMALDKEMGAKIAPLAKPYPKRVKQAMTGLHPEQRRRDTDLPAPFTSNVIASEQTDKSLISLQKAA